MVAARGLPGDKSAGYVILLFYLKIAATNALKAFRVDDSLHGFHNL